MITVRHQRVHERRSNNEITKHTRFLMKRRLMGVGVGHRMVVVCRKTIPVLIKD